MWQTANSANAFTDPTLKASYTALDNAAKANVSGASQTMNDDWKAQDDECNVKAREAIDKSRVEYHPVGSLSDGTAFYVSCTPIEVRGRPVPSPWGFSDGVDDTQSPVTILINNCLTGGQSVFAVLTPPPPDTFSGKPPPPGLCGPGTYWSGSTIVGCQPCPPNLPGFRGACPAQQANATATPTPTPPPPPKPPNPCNQPPPVIISHQPPPVTPVLVSHEPLPATPVLVSHEPPPSTGDDTSTEKSHKPARKVARKPARNSPAPSGGDDGAAAVGAAIGLIGGLLSGGGGHGGGGGNPCHR